VDEQLRQAVTIETVEQAMAQGFPKASEIVEDDLDRRAELFQSASPEMSAIENG
jgi:hypothetical protein